MTRRTSLRRWLTCGTLGAAAVLAWPSQASAQLDPLLFLKRTRPNVLIVVETGNRMQRDADNVYYDANTYVKTLAFDPLNPTWEMTLGVTPLNTAINYRRKYLDLAHTDIAAQGDKFSATSIEIVGDRQLGYGTFWAKTRLELARVGVIRAMLDNAAVARFGLMRTRQSNPQWGAPKNEGPVKMDAANLMQQDPTETGNWGKWKITRPEVDAVNGSIAGVQAPLVAADSPTANTDAYTILNRGVNVAGALIPAGRDSLNVLDVPIEYMLDDARAEAARLIGADTVCRNTIVVLVVGGKEGTTAASQNPAGKASQFLNVSGRRVPIYVVAIAPAPDAVAQLQSVAANSGGQYVEITKAMIDAVAPGVPVPEISRAVNLAVQHSFADPTDFNTAPTAQYPFGPPSEFQVTSPIVGTVNLEDAKDIDGALLPLTRITHPNTGNEIPQRVNVIMTSGFSLPGFDGKLRAFRLYKPVADATKPAGYKFVLDFTKLWVASVPAPNARNLYTVLPDGSMVAFTTANVNALSPYLNTSDPAGLIDYIRGLPFGPIVSSTPAVMDPPSLDPPPDSDYPGFADANKNRRSIVWVGTNFGMMHAIDARLGVEVWGLIPFNLLPKLRALQDGQAVDKFDYFVDSSPKVADVKLPNCSGSSCWKTNLIFGQGAGGTFYQTLDVTLAGMAGIVSPTSDVASDVLSYFAMPGVVGFKWSFPLYSEFDHTIAPYGDVFANASAVAKSVGETWSDPAVGQIERSTGPFAVLAGSGFFAYSKQQQANRGGAVAGTTFYLLNADTGAVFDSRDVGSDALAENVDNCSVAGDCSKLKNALQADPVATGPPDSRFVTKAYLGDLDGRVWRFDITIDPVTQLPRMTGNPTKLFSAGPPSAAHPIFSSMAAVNVGGTQQYLFFGTGSDLLPSTGVSQNYQLLGVLDTGAAGQQKFAYNLIKTDNAADDEKVTSFPAVAGDIVFFTTSAFKPAAPCTKPDSFLYALTFIGGPAYDNSGDDRVTAADTPKVKTVVGGRASAPFIVDQHLVFGVGTSVQVMGDPEDFNNGVGQVGVRILSWREVR